jgi:hypothetical protein
MMNYTKVANELAERILKLIPNHLEILDFNSAWDLFKIDGLVVDDLEPTLYQASWALEVAKNQYAKRNAA